MTPFGKVIGVEGIDSDQPKPVWSGEVSIFESKESGHAAYHVCYQRQSQANSEDIDKAVRAALETVVQRLTVKGASKA